MSKVMQGEGNFDFIGKMGLYAIPSAVLVLVSIVATAVMGLNYGIDFAGGYEIQVKFPQAVDEGKIRELVQPLVGDALVQRFGQEGENEFLILVRKHGSIDADKRLKV